MFQTTNQLKTFQAKNRHRIAHIAKDFWIKSWVHLSLMRFSEIQEDQAEPTCNYVSKV